jgi:hypothetical protein
MSERYKIFCEVDKHIDVSRERVKLKGYRLYVIENWLLSTGKFYCTYLHQTKNPKDQVIFVLLLFQVGARI